MSGYEIDNAKVNQPNVDGILSSVQAMQKQQEEAAAKAGNSPFSGDTLTISNQAKSTYKSQLSRFEDSQNSPGRSMNASEASVLAKQIGEAQAELAAAEAAMLAAGTGNNVGDAGNTGGDAGNTGGDTGNTGGDAGNTGGDAGNDDSEAENNDAEITSSANDDAASLGTKGAISEAGAAIGAAREEKAKAAAAALEAQKILIMEQIEEKEAQVEELLGEHSEVAMVKLELLQQEVAVLRAVLIALEDPDKD